MEFIEKYGKQLFIGVGVFVILAFVVTLITQGSVKKEKESQEKYFALEAKVKKYREEKFKQSQSAQEKIAVQESVQVDINQLKADLESFISSNLGTVAAQFAGLELAQILSEENKLTEALSLLQKVETQSDLLSNSLVKMKIGQILADLDKCSDALVVWSKIINSKKFAYIHAESKINQALCYKKMNELQKAEEILNQVKNEKSEDSAEQSREADRILRLIQFNKSFGS